MQVADYVFATTAPEYLDEEAIVITTQIDPSFWWKISRLEEMAEACGFNLQAAACTDGNSLAAEAIFEALNDMAGCQADPYDLSCTGQNETEWLTVMESLMCPAGRALELAELRCVTAFKPDWPAG